MKQSGTIKNWNDEKGFGFIKSGYVNQDFFFHIKEFENRGSRPAIGMKVCFEPGTDGQGRNHARNVRVVGSNNLHPAVGAFILSVGFLGGVGLLSVFGYVPEVISWIYVAASVLSFIFYFFDKSAAQKGSRRTPEATLHNLAIIGGWPGALFAQQLLRHKSKKASFRTVFWVTVFLNIAALMYLLSPYGSWLQNSINKIMG